MKKLLLTTLSSIATLILLVSPNVASPLPGPPQQDQTTNNPPKKPAANPKKAASTKSSTDGDKVKTDERMSTRGLKPPPKDSSASKDTKTVPKTDADKPK